MASPYILSKEVLQLPRLPLEGRIDLTYRCNNYCRHCWLWMSPDTIKPGDEISFDEIKHIAEEARRMGCREWCISGGEPMLRPDFMDIFDLLTSKTSTYTLNTNGTLITPQIAQLLKRKGNKLIALYGATAQVHDDVTRTPGSFEALVRGVRYLQEAKAGFTVQLIPMKTNFHQFEQMKALALSWSKYYRVGAEWLYLSASRDPLRNEEIVAQRLSPSEYIALSKEGMVADAYLPMASSCAGFRKLGEGLFAACANGQRGFHIDPFGGMSFCAHVKDPALRYALRQGNFKQAWDEFIPSLASRAPAGDLYQKECGSCSLQADCRICAAYSYLEHGTSEGKIDYLCALAREEKKWQDNWGKDHCRYFQIAGITLQMNSDVSIKDFACTPALQLFEVPSPGEDVVSVTHYFELPDFKVEELGKEVYRHPPWAVFQRQGSWIYLEILPDGAEASSNRIAVFNHDYTKSRIYHKPWLRQCFHEKGIASVALLPTDQVLIAQLLADRKGCYLHSCGVDWNGRGYLFAGHSGAGKSTMAKMLSGHVELLCDDRMIIRKREDGFRIYGTWHHGELPQVSPGSAPLNAIFFLNKSEKNEVRRMEDKKEIVRRLLPILIRPFVTPGWWEKTLSLLDHVAQDVPCYELYCDKSGKIVNVLQNI